MHYYFVSTFVGEQQNGAGVNAVDCTIDKGELPMTARINVPGMGGLIAVVIN